jgi:hypothetical protein
MCSWRASKTALARGARLCERPLTRLWGSDAEHGESAIVNPAWRVFSDAGVRPHKQVEHLTDRPFATDRVTKWEMPLNPVAVAPPGLLFDHAPVIDEIGHEAVCAALGDADLDGDVTDTQAAGRGRCRAARAWLVRKLQLAVPQL